MSTKKDLQYYINTKIETDHEWGDGWEYWNDLHKAINECSEVFRKARIWVYDKEKYGTYRCDIFSLWDGTVRGALGGYRMWLGDSWYDKFDRWIADNVVPKKFINWIHKKQKAYVNKHMQEIYKKYPYIVNELLCDVDFYEWIKGVVDGAEIHYKYWNMFGTPTNTNPKWEDRETEMNEMVNNLNK